MEQIYDTLPCSTLRVSLETEGNGQSHPFAPWSKCKKRSRREHLRLRFSLSKNYPSTHVSGIIKEKGVFSWKAGEKMHGMSQSS